MTKDADPRMAPTGRFGRPPSSGQRLRLLLVSTLLVLWIAFLIWQAVDP